METGYSEGIASISQDSLERTDSRVACEILCKQEEGRHAAIGVQFETYDSREESSRILWR